MRSNESISKTQYERIMTSITELIQKCRVSMVLLVNSAGRVVAEKSTGHVDFETTVLSTLASGSYAAAAEMAKQLGEKSNFKMMLHEGETLNIFISSITEDYFLVIIFETGVALGMVRLFGKRSMIQMNQVLSEKPKNEFADLFDQHFQGLLNEKLNESFLDEI